ncbi:onanonoxo-7-onima-8-eninoihtemlysoneda [Phyllosticta citriasiana]|uniref:Onanonoxo-7-onima-8-eninoihtemlysoneda n=1 Tax=Phyllosticta citriasiana TaxID=595635 RepID=A0ABR1KR28_9PEZI
MAPAGAILYRNLRAYQVWGANTEVGKTVFSTVLCNGLRVNRKLRDPVQYIKPVSTGNIEDADSSHVRKFGIDRLAKHLDNTDEAFKSLCLHQYELPISPDRAAAVSNLHIPKDEALLNEIRQVLSERAELGGWAFIETAGGVHSPGPSGTSQADLYRPLRVPAVLIADSKLGGISQTIAAYESLKIRGYDVEAVLLFEDDYYQNDQQLKSYFKQRGTLCRTLPKLHPPQASKEADEELMLKYYEKQSKSEIIQEVLINLRQKHHDRLQNLQSMPKRAHDIIWYPFTQSTLLSPEKITAIDSASGDYFQTLEKNQGTESLLKSSFDGSGSWWTQGLGHGNPQLMLAAAYAAGRYGHVMFAEAVHEPALKLAGTLIDYLSNPRLSRVFYSDNGSTGIEVAVKMALRAARLRYGWGPNDNLGVLGLSGSYHGDTMGAMDCSEPSTYNEKIEWYEAKGFWFSYPTVSCNNGRWTVSVPQNLKNHFGSDKPFRSLADIIDLEARESSREYEQYRVFITQTLKQLRAQGRRFGALMLEPIVLGAGGMVFVDPLFQRALVSVVRSSPQLFADDAHFPNSANAWTGLPVIFDEVFTGLYRLGRSSAASLLQVHPDISVHAKLLTGGLLPLCATAASEDIFKAFESDDKSDALLHGHSYTAHAVGCTVAIESLKEMRKLDTTGAWDEFKSKWAGPAQEREQEIEPIWSVWGKDFVEWTSNQERVEGVWALGSVLSITLKDSQGAGGYKSTAAKDVQAALFKGDSPDWNIHSRILGNVIYFMAGQTTSMETVERVQNVLRKVLV